MASSEKKASQLRDSIVDALSEAKVVRNNVGEYRFTGSALPVCPRKVLLYRTRYMAREDTPKGESCMSVGTANHAVVQKWLAERGLLVGKFVRDFKPYPSSQFKDEFSKNDYESYDMTSAVGPVYNKDGSLASYTEFRVFEPRSRFSGYVDGVVRIPSTGEYAIVDFKFVGDWSFNKLFHGLAETDPYYYQLQAYRYVLEKYPPVIDGEEVELSTTSYLIVFREGCLRDMRPDSVLVIPVEYDKQVFLGQRKTLKRTMDAIRDRDTTFFEGDESRVCRTEKDCGFCRGKYLCFARDYKKELSNVIDEAYDGFSDGGKG